jgi:uncharacterized C2H2 Zn-finger protein
MMESKALIQCDACGVVLMNKEEQTEHVFHTHYEKRKGLKRAILWAGMML